MTKIKSGKSSDTRPCHKRYTEEKKWLKNKARKIAKHQKEVEKQRVKLENRVERIEKLVLPVTGVK